MNRTPPRSLAILADDKPDGKDARRCGPCVECCTASGIPELNKPAGVRCQHLSLGEDGGRKGCRIYETRPESCRTFRCLWLDGMGPKKHRPDRLGMFFAIYEPPEAPLSENVPGVLGRDMINGHRRVIAAIECHVDALRDGGKGEALRTVREMAAVAPVSIVRYPKPVEPPKATEEKKS